MSRPGARADATSLTDGVQRRRTIENDNDEITRRWVNKQRKITGDEGNDRDNLPHDRGRLYDMTI